MKQKVANQCDAKSVVWKFPTSWVDIDLWQTQQIDAILTFKPSGSMHFHKWSIIEVPDLETACCKQMYVYTRGGSGQDAEQTQIVCVCLKNDRAMPERTFEAHASEFGVFSYADGLCFDGVVPASIYGLPVAAQLLHLSVFFFATIRDG